MTYDINYNLERGTLTPLGVSVYQSDIEQMLAEEVDFLDMENFIVYIPDMGDGNLYGVMVAELPFDAVIDNDENIADWALANIPAPGTGAANRMGLLDVNEASAWIAEKSDRFAVINR